ncbi:MAG: hypothetical protein D6694_02610 [Gammaproteobacteria bacterium]|nr:MAG: hypothetical protein D6694_02610 [Gammaproteobacteria bacterium]
MSEQNPQAFLERQIIFLIERSSSEAEVIEALLAFPKAWVIAHELGRVARETSLAEALATSGLFAELSEEKQALVTATQKLNKGWRAYLAFVQATKWHGKMCELIERMQRQGVRRLAVYGLLWLFTFTIVAGFQSFVVAQSLEGSQVWLWGTILASAFPMTIAYVARRKPSHRLAAWLLGITSGKRCLTRLRDIARTGIDGQTNGHLTDEDKTALRTAMAIGTVSAERHARCQELLAQACEVMERAQFGRRLVLIGIWLIWVCAWLGGLAKNF